jgi:hypothetical protein
LDSNNAAYVDIVEEDRFLEETATVPQNDDIEGESTDITEEEDCSLHENDTCPQIQDFDVESNESPKPVEAEAEDDHRGDLNESGCGPQIQDSEAESIDIIASSSHAGQEFIADRTPIQTVRRIDGWMFPTANRVQVDTVSELPESSGWPGTTVAFFTTSSEAFSTSEIHSHPSGQRGINILHRVVAFEALHDAADRFPQPRSHPGTCTQMLDDLYQLATQGNSSQPVGWRGGAGRSAIMQFLCHKLPDAGRLGGAFFFKRSHATRRNTQGLYSTLAYL